MKPVEKEYIEDEFIDDEFIDTEPVDMDFILDAVDKMALIYLIQMKWTRTWLTLKRE